MPPQNEEGAFMHRSSVYPLFAVLTICLALPTSAPVRDWDVPGGGLARNDAECQAQFNRADLNGDGVLSPGEISNRRGLIPPRLTASEDGLIDRQEFLATCSESARANDSSGG